MFRLPMSTPRILVNSYLVGLNRWSGIHRHSYTNSGPSNFQIKSFVYESGNAVQRLVSVLRNIGTNPMANNGVIVPPSIRQTNPENCIIIRDLGDLETLDESDVTEMEVNLLNETITESFDQTSSFWELLLKSTDETNLTPQSPKLKWKSEPKPKEFIIASFGSVIDKIWNDKNTKTAKQFGRYVVNGIWEILLLLGKSVIPRRFRYKNISGQVVVITGAGSGIGRLIAKSLALEHGAIVVSWDINLEGNFQTVQEIKNYGGMCHSYVVDVTSRKSVYETAAKVANEIGKVDILVNSVGVVSGNKRFLNTDDDEIKQTFEVNTMSNFWLAKAFLPDMINSGRGHIVTISSLAGLVGMNQMVDYCSSKFAAVGFHDALTNELRYDEKSKFIKTTLVCPYYIHTGMFHGVNSKIIPVLRPQPVADDIVAGILSNQEMIIIPRYLYLLVLMKNAWRGCSNGAFRSWDYNYDTFESIWKEIKKMRNPNHHNQDQQRTD